MAYIYDLTDTWNAGGTTFNGIKLNVTDTASAASSKLVSLQTNGTEHFSVTKAGVGYFSGNVGIGTAGGAAASSRLTIGSTAATSSDINLRTTTTDFAITPSNSAAGGVTISTSWVSGGQGPLIFTNSGGERMRISSDGSVLVGTTTADNKLTVSSSASGAATGVLSLVNPNDSAGTAADLDFVTHSSGTLATGRIRGLIGGADNYPMSFWTYGSGGLAERMRIDASGNVGIGTSSPSRKLTVAGTTNAYMDFSASSFRRYTIGSETNGFVLFDENAAAYRMVVDASGNLLVGTTAAGTTAAKVIGMANATAPTTSPAGMGQLYVEGGALKFRGSSGTVTTIAPA